MSLKTKYWLSLFLVSMSIAFTACKKKAATTAVSYDIPEKDLKPVKNDWYINSLISNPDTLNPLLATAYVSSVVIDFIFESLITTDSMSGESAPRLAESWKVSEDGLTYDFQLRSKVFFHDGHPLTAEDVKFTFDALKNPKVDAPALQNYFMGLGSTEVIDPSHVRFHMKNRYYRNLVMLGDVKILPKHIYGDGDFNKHPANRKPVGSGPYKFIKWEDGRLIELDRVSDHWTLGVPEWKDHFNFNKILFRIITETSVQVMALKKGEIDDFEPPPTIYLNDFSDPKYEKEFYKLEVNLPDGNGYSFIGWNELNPLLNSKKTRLALAYAMPREEISKKVYHGMRRLSVGPFAPANPKSDPDLKPLPYDPKRAVELLREDGFQLKDGSFEKNGKKLKFELLFGSGVAESEQVALIYQQALKDIGVQMDIKTLEWTVFLKEMQGHKFDAVMLSWAPVLDEDPYQCWHSSQATGDGSNFISYKNSQVDDLITKARITLDKTERNKLYREFSRLVVDDMPYLFLFEKPNLWIGTKRFKHVLPPGKLGLDNTAWFTPIGLEKYKAHP